jgi:hypothetical protein
MEVMLARVVLAPWVVQDKLEVLVEQVELRDLEVHHMLEV